MRLFLIVLCLACACFAAHAQSVPNPSASSGIDASGIRRRAEQIRELKTLLADPDANVRLLTMQDAIASADPTMRNVAIEAGLASNETAMVNVALRGMLTGRSYLLLRLRQKQQKDGGAESTLKFAIEKYDPTSGRIEGVSTCTINDKGEWVGLITGSAITFAINNNRCSGRLEWMPETGEFSGMVNVDGGDNRGERFGSWKPF